MRIVLALLLAALPGCSALTPPEAAAIEGADALACGMLNLIPIVGGFFAEACVGEEGRLKAALDRAVAARAPPPKAAAAPLVVVHAKRGAHRRMVGAVPQHLAAVTQAALDAMPADAGTVDAGAFPPFPTPVYAGLPLLDGGTEGGR